MAFRIVISLVIIAAVLFGLVLPTMMYGYAANVRMFLMIGNLLATIVIGSVFAITCNSYDRSSVPWFAYIASGLCCVGAFALINAAAFVYDPAIEVNRFTPSPEQSVAVSAWPVVDYLMRWWPSSLLNFALGFGLAALPRLKQWPAIGGSRWLERLLDGLVLGATCIVSRVASVYLHAAIPTPIGQRYLGHDSLLTDMALRIVVSPLSLVGFLVGALMVRDLRKILRHRAEARATGTDVAASPSAAVAGESAKVDFWTWMTKLSAILGIASFAMQLMQMLGIPLIAGGP